MTHNLEKVSDVLARIRKLFDAGRPQEAAELIRRFGTAAPLMSNAYGVALMRSGEPARAIDVYRNLVISESGVCLRPDVPVFFKTNYATALLLTRNIAGCLSVLREINDEQHPEVVRLRAAIAEWKRTLGRWQRFWLSIAGEASGKPVQLSFPPGVLDDPHPLRPAA